MYQKYTETSKERRREKGNIYVPYYQQMVKHNLTLQIIKRMFRNVKRERGEYMFESEFNEAKKKCVGSSFLFVQNIKEKDY